VEPGDRVLAKGSCTMPLRAWCLDAGAGFLRYDTYGAVGHGNVLARYDGTGRVSWRLRLADLFSPQQVSGFRNTAGSTWWSETQWLDRRAGELVVVYETPRSIDPHDPVHGPNAGPLRAPGVLRVRLSDGAHAFGRPEDLLPGLGLGDDAQRLRVLDAVARARPAGWRPALAGILGDGRAPSALRVMAAVRLAEAGDGRGKAYALATARGEHPSAARARALRHLRLFLGDAALPALRASLRAASREESLAIQAALRDFGPQARETLLAMLKEKDAPILYRRTALGLIAQLGAQARPLLADLEALAAEERGPFAEELRFALKGLRRDLEKAPR
jgi:hypothetical protein